MQVVDLQIVSQYVLRTGCADEVQIANAGAVHHRNNFIAGMLCTPVQTNIVIVWW